MAINPTHLNWVTFTYIVSSTILGMIVALLIITQKQDDGKGGEKQLLPCDITLLNYLLIVITSIVFLPFMMLGVAIVSFVPLIIYEQIQICRVQRVELPVTQE